MCLIAQAILCFSRLDFAKWIEQAGLNTQREGCTLFFSYVGRGQASTVHQEFQAPQEIFEILAT